MSSNTNSNNNFSSTSTPSIASDWTTIPDAQLNWDDNNMEEIAAAKFQERCWCKKIWEAEEPKHQEEEELCKAEEAEQRCKAEEEARAHAAAEEKKKSMGVKKRLACMGCTKLKEKCKWPVVEIGGGSSKQVLLQGGEKKKRARKSTMVDNKVVVEGWKMGQLEAGGSDVVAEAIHELMRELTGRLDMLTNGVLKELQGQLNVLENLIKTQQNLGWKMSQHYAVLEDMLGELEVFATNPGEPLGEEDTVDKEDLEEKKRWKENNKGKIKTKEKGKKGWITGNW
ncbi:hypothetical protein ID866_11113 [Astraeus odoratus]|nr:hypothetical protein ID866_11113 [Astraeus odoratus]